MTPYEYIRTETDPSKLYAGVRAILTEMDACGKYPEDWEIKKLQRLADVKYYELTTGTRPKKNRIPRRFFALYVKMIINTSHTRPGDIIHISKNDFGYLGYNTRTNSYSYYSPALLRDGECCELLEVIA